MIDIRIYRAAFVPALFVAVALLLSVDPAPPPLQPPPSGVATSEFDAARARRAPGGAAMQNAFTTLPGESERTIAVIAAPGSDGAGEGGAPDIATGALIELASAFGSVRHEKTLILASTEAGEGAVGARELLDSLPAPDRIEAVVTIAGPGEGESAGPEVLSDSAGPESTSAQLVETARAAVRSETGRQVEPSGPLGAFLGLALPGGDGAQADLIAAGVDAVGIGGGGSVDELGRVAFWLVSALDAAPRPPIHGPGAWVELSGNLVPGWALALLALALLLPAAAAAVDALLRARRRNRLLVPGISREVVAPLAGAASVVAVAGIWVVNPYLALLCVPAAHLWVLWPIR